MGWIWIRRLSEESEKAWRGGYEEVVERSHKDIESFDSVSR